MDNLLKIVNFLGKHIYKKHTMHALSKLLDIPYATFYRTVKKHTDILKTESVGKSKIVSLNPSHATLKSYLSISSDEERKEFLNHYPIIKKITSELHTSNTVLLFGSYASKKAHTKSDIDIMVINKDGKRSIDFSKYELLFNRKINPIFFKVKEFALMLKDKEENVVTQALQNHIVLNNPEKFWEILSNTVLYK